MKLVVVGNYPIFRKGIISIITNQADIHFCGEADTIKGSLTLIEKTKPDIVLTDVILENGNGLDLFLSAKARGLSSKFILLGIYGDSEFILRSWDKGVEGYILREANPAEILHAIRQIYSGKRYLDTDLLEFIFKNEKAEEISLLTSRENEILIALGRGMSNKQIAESFFISESTVKKHVSQVLFKLKLRDRTQAAIYANSKGLIV